MRHQTKKSPNWEERGSSQNIHNGRVNKQYFSMILANQECQYFCCEVLMHLDSLINKYCQGDLTIERSKRVDMYLALASLDRGQE